MRLLHVIVNKYYGGLVTEAAGPDFKTNYTYDRAGRRTSMTDGQGTTSYAYDPANGSLTGLKYPDGTKITYEYNKQSLAGASAAAGGSLDSMTFDYAPNGLLKGQSSSRGLSTRFSYNGLDLSGVTVEQDSTALHQFGYERDGNKNIIGRTQNGEDTCQGEIRDPQSLNWYACVANNPLGYVDPSGQEFMPTTKGGIFYTNQKNIIHCERVEIFGSE
ncbi:MULTISPECIES: RHS repeat domain-containing protein [unclassified Paenibacillus]|uniref:RHS repeat domain-containing protein n=1 Tax=unclassified Paenibacillus TaxID=185978 RepID=UPI0024BAB26F|nr:MULTISPECIES: RHS repeat domain-containing protein [unclassified Paenibacillus]